MIEIVPLHYYSVVYDWVMYSICILTGLYYLTAPGCNKLLRQYSILLPLLLSIVLILYIGLRPISGRYFGDMTMYRHAWKMADVSSFSNFFDFKSEWFFELVMKFCKKIVPNVQFWFVIVEAFYVGCQFYALKKLLWENVWLAILFTFFAYQFFTFGTNGLRNGMGCSLMMLSIAYFCERNKRGTIIGIFIFLLAMGCHRSVMIPMAALIISIFWVKDIKTAFLIWLACIVISLFSGDYFLEFFSGLGIDDRMSTYSTLEENRLKQFSHLGFRWDFLLYSSMPVWISWYVMDKEKEDKAFTLISNTYILSNSFWVLICRVAYSNRFAYLSWFLYGLVIAYAVVRLPIWRNQDRSAGWILLAHSSFTIFMHVIGL